MNKRSWLINYTLCQYQRKEWTDDKSGQIPHTSAKKNLVRIRTPKPDYFQNLTGTFLSKDTCVIEFSRTSDHSLQIVELFCNVEESVKKSCIRIRRRMTSKNLISSSSTDSTSVVKMWSRSVQYRPTIYVQVVNRRTDRQTNAGITQAHLRG